MASIDGGASGSPEAGRAADLVAEDEVVEAARGRPAAPAAPDAGNASVHFVGRLRKRLSRAFDAEVVGEPVDVDRRARRDAAQQLEKAARGREARVHLEQEVAAEQGLFVLAFLCERSVCRNVWRTFSRASGARAGLPA